MCTQIKKQSHLQTGWSPCTPLKWRLFVASCTLCNLRFVSLFALMPFPGHSLFSLGKILSPLRLTHCAYQLLPLFPPWNHLLSSQKLLNQGSISDSEDFLSTQTPALIFGPFKTSTNTEPIPSISLSNDLAPPPQSPTPLVLTGTPSVICWTFSS